MQNILQNLVGRLLLRALMQKIIIDESVATAVVKVAKCSIYSGCLGAVQKRHAGPVQRSICGGARRFGEDQICSVLEFCRTFIAQIWSSTVQALKKARNRGPVISCLVETESSEGPALHAEPVKFFSRRKYHFAAFSAEGRRSRGPAPSPPLAKGLQSQIPIRP